MMAISACKLGPIIALYKMATGLSEGVFEEYRMRGYTTCNLGEYCCVTGTYETDGGRVPRFSTS